MILTTQRNYAGIYGVQIYLRGKPWVISVDENLFFK
jgi:hypothetical protein